MRSLAESSTRGCARWRRRAGRRCGSRSRRRRSRRAAGRRRRRRASERPGARSAGSPSAARSSGCKPGDARDPAPVRSRARGRARRARPVRVCASSWPTSTCAISNATRDHLVFDVEARGRFAGVERGRGLAELRERGRRAGSRDLRCAPAPLRSRRRSRAVSLRCSRLGCRRGARSRSGSGRPRALRATRAVTCPRSAAARSRRRRACTRTRCGP